MAKKIGVYICTSCDIGNRVDIEKVKEYIDSECSPALIKELPFLCGQEGVEAIKKDIAEEEINAVCIAGCSPRVNWDVFDFGPEVLVERANIRELGVWSFKEPEDLPPIEETDLEADHITMMVQDYIKMAVMKLEKAEKPEPEIPEINKTILVVGGGFTGLSAALDAAKAGYDVVIVEKEDRLGGFAAKMYKKTPSKYPFTSTEENDIEKLIAEVEQNDKIKVLTSAAIQKIAGAPGIYEATVKVGEEEQTLNIGAVVLATGWKPYDASKLSHLGYGQIKNVVTNVEFETLAKEGLKRPSDGAPVKSVAFIQCAGQRDPEHLPYCSSICCMVSLKQAQYVRELDENAKAFIFYKDMRTTGIMENYYKAAQDDPGIFLTKAEVEEISQDGDQVVVKVKDTLLGEDLEVKVDMLVLATGIVPTTAEEAKLELECKSQAKAENEESKPEGEVCENPLLGKLKEVSCLKLQYRQGPTFPDMMLFDGFADSNYICFPYETRRTGIYAAGCVRQPMGMVAAKEDATGAALKAIQCIESANRGVAVHPRSGDMSYPKFNFVRCTQCKRCTEECPFGALDDDEKGTPKPNPTRCRRCGTCMGACPERVISFDNYSITIVNDMITSIQVPEYPEDGGYRILVLCCENDAYPALDMAAMRGKKWSSYVRFIPVRCLGSVNTQWIAEAMSKGIDGVLLLGCKYGEDYQCHFVKGSELCNRRMENVAETLARLQVESERVKQVQVSIDEYDKVPEIIDQFVEEIEGFGANPYKGF